MTASVKERPIIMSAPMVCAILDGRKTQTRRIVKPQPVYVHGEDKRATFEWRRGLFALHMYPTNSTMLEHCPYGKPGDHLYVRERIDNRPECGNFYYAADNAGVGPFVFDGLMSRGWAEKKSIPSIHMPKWASRITLELTDVRVERLQNMEGAHPTESDALAEGINRIHHGDGNYFYSAFRDDPHPKNWRDPVDAFRELWDSLNAKRAPWDSSPWVWVLSFEVIPG